ncbi:hypothetical protein H206_03006 [Candidatus Electrothrix aarhusensis]|uniref:Uncharacterized protein n=1 Tax=Candidatus Electrothrix aarhusensis TaxID=1859131 RepID=A0A3S3QV47_9BACT|nr:hypothetical protein H206_03006 [Candidatus Electrothrix aarhusensis]
MVTMKKSEKYIWPILLLATIYLGLWNAATLAIIALWCVWFSLSLLYLFSSESYERNCFLKLSVFISLTIAIPSLYGIVMKHGEIIDKALLQSQLSKPLKMLLFHLSSAVYAIITSFVFAPIAVKIGGKHILVFCICGALFLLLMQEYLHALFLFFSSVITFLSYWRVVNARA